MLEKEGSRSSERLNKTNNKVTQTKIDLIYFVNIVLIIPFTIILIIGNYL